MAAVTPDVLITRWGALLEGCPAAVTRQFVEALVAEGLDPEDTASLVELTPQLLDALGLDDQNGRDCVLALVCSANEDAVAKHSLNSARTQRRWSRQSPLTGTAPSVPDGCELQVSTPPPEDEKGKPWGVGAFERRVFQQTDRRGVQAQEVVPGVFLGGFAAATNAQEQRKFGITHIVNATSRRLDVPGAKVLCLHLKDADGDQDISCHFWPVIAFIEEALAAGNAALVHCIRGVSRSSTLVCAYIIARGGRGMQEALALVQQARPVAKPRPGFIGQLKAFNLQLASASNGRGSHESAAETASGNDTRSNRSRRWRSTQ